VTERTIYDDLARARDLPEEHEDHGSKY